MVDPNRGLSCGYIDSLLGVWGGIGVVSAGW